MIRELGITGQARAMQIRGDDAALHRAVDAVTRAIARTRDHPGQRLRIGAENRTAAVVFKAGEFFGDTGQQGLCTTSPMVRFGWGDVVRSSRPTPSTRSPADVSYQWPST